MCSHKLATETGSPAVSATAAAAATEAIPAATACAGASAAGAGKSKSVYTRLNKPAASYTALIATAIQDSPQKKLTLLEIIGRLQQKYECFNGAYKGWKNSIRHTLSVNKCFVKVPRDASRPYAKDNFWTLAAVEDYVNADGTFRLRRRRAGKRRGSSDEYGRSSPDSEKAASPSQRRAPGDPGKPSPPPPPPPSPPVSLASGGTSGGSPAASCAKFSGPFSIESLLMPSKGAAQAAAVARARRAFAIAVAEAPRWDVAAFAPRASPDGARLALAEALAGPLQRGACSCTWPVASEPPYGCQVTYPGTEGAAYGFAAAGYLGVPLVCGGGGASFSQPVC